MQKAKGVPCMMIWTIPEYFQKLNLVHVSSVGVNGNPPIYWKNVSINEAGFSGEHILMTTGSISKACFVSSTGWEEKNGHPNILQYDWGFISFLTHYRIPQIIVFDHFLTKDFTPSWFYQKINNFMMYRVTPLKWDKLQN